MCVKLSISLRKLIVPLKVLLFRYLYVHVYLEQRGHINLNHFFPAKDKKNGHSFMRLGQHMHGTL